MATQRVSMPDFRKILRLRFDSKLSHRQIALSTGVSKGAVQKYLCLFETAGLAWPLPDEVDDATLAAKLCPKVGGGVLKYAMPDCLGISQAIKEPGVTLALLWEEYVEAHGLLAFRYSAFCQRYRQWSKRQATVMRQVHKAGEKAFVDYSGVLLPIHNAATGEVRDAQIFVMVMGASNYTFAEATWTQRLPDWIASHVRAYRFFGAVPTLTIPDNLRSGVKSADRYEPLLNETYEEMAAHYGTAVLPARPYKPRDKAKVEAGVQLVQRWILARLRKRTFFSLAEANAAMAELLKDLNNRPFKKMPEHSRLTLFQSLDRPAMRTLPAEDYVFMESLKARVHMDYHLEVDHHLYSVPYTLVGQQLDVRLGARVVDFLLHGKKVASHPRSFIKHGRTTATAHMPQAHRKHMDWTPGRLLSWGNQMGPRTRDVVRHLLENRPHPEHGYRSCLGLLRLEKKYTAPRLEAACERALALRAANYRSVKNILATGLDRQELPRKEEELFTIPDHGNVRGPHYYH
jgi:transposase